MSPGTLHRQAQALVEADLGEPAGQLAHSNGIHLHYLAGMNVGIGDAHQGGKLEYDIAGRELTPGGCATLTRLRLRPTRRVNVLAGHGVSGRSEAEPC